MPVRFGVLGTSSIARRRVLPAMAANEDIDLVAVAGRSHAKARSFADPFGSCADADAEALLGRADIDAVYVSTPTSTHPEWTARALAAGKHVLVEKPIATTADEAYELVRLAEARGLVLRENFMFLHHPQHDTVRDMVSSGRLGELRGFSSSFCIPPLPASDIRYVPELGGGALLDVGVYPLRAALSMLGPGLGVAGAALRVRPSDGLDLSGEALVYSPSGVLASLTFGFEHAYGSRYALWGSRARITVDRAFTPPASFQPSVVLEEQDHEETFRLPPADQLARCLSSFAAAVRTGAGTSPGEAAWHAGAVATMELVDAIRERAVQVAVEGEE
ncbi:Gfo/Idh/MocA family protein [Streptomyces sp. NPDC019443]|uniref:Gfo/Idh/MocA family protein n=1 Tax=Streptomyces sp. NPDC019443 TaxID=3365061 RepID=UPI00378B21B2